MTAVPTVADITPVVTPDGLPNLDYTPLSLLRAIRGADLFNGIFRFYNLRRHPLTNRAHRVEGDQPAFIGLDLPGQHFGEEALYHDEAVDVPLRARLAGRSRIVVRMPQGVTGPRIAVPDLLHVLSDWPLSVDPLARYRSGGIPKDMLAAVKETFVGLALQLLAHLAQMGLFTIGSVAASRARPLVDTAYGMLLGNPTTALIASASEDVRDMVAAASDDLAADARSAMSGNQAEKDEAAETAEALLEVHFALGLARRILDGDQDFGISLLWMSGLFDLMMHPHMPQNTSTALELPYRLITSPDYWTAFEHSGDARSRDLSSGERVELWTTRLVRWTGATHQEIPPEGVNFYALYSPDYDLETDLNPDIRMSLDHDDRRRLVKRTTGHNEDTTGGIYNDPAPAKVRRLELTPLGANMQAWGNWPDKGALFPDFGDLVGWEHKIDLGRDTTVRIVEAGWLYPMGIKVRKVTLTERQFRQGSGTGSDRPRVAVLIQKVFLTVEDADAAFPADGQAHGGRGLPFQRIVPVTKVTPPLDETPDIVWSGRKVGQRVEVGGQSFRFEFVGIDSTGRETGFSLPQFFVPSTFAAAGSAGLSKLDAEWRGDGHAAKMAGQVVRMVSGGGPEMDFPLDDMVLEATNVAGNLTQAIVDGARPFHPIVETATAHLPSLRELTGLDHDVVRQIRFTPAYLADAFPGAGNRVVLELLDDVVLDFADELGSDAMGAVGQANQRLRVIAEGLGPVPLPDPARLNQMIRGQLDWDDLLPEFRILGRFLLQQFLDALGADMSDLPTFKARRDQHHLIREWKLDKKTSASFTAGPIEVTPRPGEQIELFLHTFVAVTLETLTGEVTSGGQSMGATVPASLHDPTAEAHGHLRWIDITLFSLIQVRFDEIAFDAVAGQKPRARVLMDPAEPLIFYGPLEFLNILKDLIPPGGFGNGPKINPGPLGIEASFDLGLPNTEVGVLALNNMTLGARTTIPFDQRPVDLRFYFNERHRPFEVAVAGFGGGGFFAMALDAGGIREIEAALEFGAQVSMNIGVASGSVSIKGGVYFSHAVGELVLEGYVELRGRLSVLSLITASLVFHMALAYEKRNQRAYVRGEATLRVKVEVLFFSASVTLHVERRFEAGASDPKFEETMGARDWIAYCDAYA